MSIEMEVRTRSSEGNLRHISINNDNHASKFCSNKISNTKYNVLNFLPKNLMEQFGRFMNKYFLLVACLQLWPAITPVNPASTWGPLTVILIVSATKEAWDDYHRHKQDKVANEKIVWVVKNGSLTRDQAQNIRVGDLVWLYENDEVPCDLVILGASESQGCCYVETASLDGETDLKTRLVPPPCVGLGAELLVHLKGAVECAPPDRNSNRFDGNLQLSSAVDDSQQCPLTINETLLQSCRLRNTEWVCGVAVYTGNETKMGMSKGLAPVKLAAADATIDRLTAAIFVFQLVIVAILGGAGNNWEAAEAPRLWYLAYAKHGPWYELLIIPLRFELLCSIMIPISLKVTMDLAKGYYSKLIEWDLQMYDDKSGTPALASNTGIAEDLGQIEYILTDKTGTLTENEMVFKRCCIKGVSYGNETGDALADMALGAAIDGEHKAALDFLLVMAICNTVVPIESSDGSVQYKAQSQDEEALVRAAAALGFALCSKHGSITGVKVKRRLVQYEVLDVLEFTSDRKRMSVVVRDLASGRLQLLTKGADEAVMPRVLPGQDTASVAHAIEQYALQGLRTLGLARRDLHEDEFAAWSAKYKEACSAVLGREGRVAEACDMLERDLELLGASAIEDRLQDQVPETIAFLRQAGIHFWMLTGDKRTTAVQIALACNLIRPEPEGVLLEVVGTDSREVGASLEAVLSGLRSAADSPATARDAAVVFDGYTLAAALRDHRDTFSALALLAKTAICCRATPSQKAELVALVAGGEYRTLAIGDGGNDVRMIQMAHVGVGISGREGLQAARAADFSFAKFRFLKRLIMVHGRYSYVRTSFIAQYSLYKSLLLAFTQIFYSLWSGISGTSLSNTFSLMAYNVAYTSLPAFFYVLDKDVGEATSMAYPHILRPCQTGELLNPGTCAGWFGRSLFHGMVVYTVALGVCGPGNWCEFEQMSLIVTSGLVWLTTLSVALATHSFTVYQHIAIWGTLVFFYLVNLIVSAILGGGMYGIMPRLVTNPSYWLAMLVWVQYSFSGFTIPIIVPVT
eukprot:jgi/Mesen1/4312/ME000022S03601